MTQQAKNWTIAVIVIVIIVGGIWWYAAAHSSSNTATSSTNTQTTQTTTTSGNDTEDTTPATGAVVVNNLSYDTAVKQYANMRIQFSVGSNNSCLVTPVKSVFKTGSVVMLDNRTPTAVAFSIGTTNYTIKAYGFRIVTLSTTYALPHAMTVNCNNGKNNGTITLEK
jgi:cytoskeletal protein RodZ